jgi:hypothetical protein
MPPSKLGGVAAGRERSLLKIANAEAKGLPDSIAPTLLLLLL